MMGSYVISVSAGTGCYRHIRISASDTLYKLHKAIICAFDFEDDHAHAFFMDNHIWSKKDAFFSDRAEKTDRLTRNYTLKKLGLSVGDKFKYLFDFGDEWIFQCKVLRVLEEATEIPCVIRSVGESPEQYPSSEADWDEGWDEDPDVEPDEEDIPFSQEEIEALYEEIEALYSEIPLEKATVDCIRKYLAAAGHLYGAIPLCELWEIYNQQNPYVSDENFLAVSLIADLECPNYWLIRTKDIVHNNATHLMKDIHLVGHYLIIENDLTQFYTLRQKQKGKPRKILPKDEFLLYEDMMYFPQTPQQTAMIQYLRTREKALSISAEYLCYATQILITFGAGLPQALEFGEEEGLTFDRNWDIGEFASLFQDLYNSTPLHANNGYTPDELFLRSAKGKKQAERNAPVGQMSLFDQQPKHNPNLTIVGKPSRNGPCPCGSGRKYKNCCGKTK